MEPKETPKHWTEGLDDRMRKHVAFAKDYAEHHAHGAPGHLDLMTIATLARALDFFSASPTSVEQ